MSLQSCGTVPWSCENWFHLVNTGASSSAASLNIAVEMLSGPVALRVFNIVVNEANTCKIWIFRLRLPINGQESSDCNVDQFSFLSIN